MRTRSPLEQSVAWALFALIVAGATASIALDRGEAARDRAAPPGSAETATGGAPPAAPAAADAAATAPPEGPRTFTIAATGDLLIHEAVADAASKTDGWDFSPMFAHVAPILRDADLAVCHVETPMSPNNAWLSHFPAFIVPRELAAAIADAGYDTCSVASNHATDAGREGIVGTIAALDRAEVAHAGMALSVEDRDRVTLVEACRTSPPRAATNAPSPLRTE